MIGFGSVGESSEDCCEMMVDGHGWEMFGVVGYSEEEVAVAVECWGEEEGEVRVD